MKKFFIVFGLLFFVVSTYSQDLNSPISVVKKKQFYQNDVRLTGQELRYILTTNPASVSSFQIYKRQTNIAMGFTLAGSGLLVVGVLYGNLPILLGALGSSVVGLAIVLPARKHLDNAINMHNTSLDQSGRRNVSFELMANSSGFGVRMRF